MKRLIYFYFLFFAFVACDNELDEQPLSNTTSIEYTNQESLQLLFADIFSKAIKDSKELRQIIKTESIKQFDNDYDVLYQLIKDKEIEGISISEYLSHYLDDQNLILEIESNLPLLTILVPELPDFNAESWNIDTDIPEIAILQSDGIVLMKNMENTFSEFPNYVTPAFPTLVIKNNERLKICDSGTLKSSGDNPVSFDFIDECFNPQNNISTLKSAQLDESYFDSAIINAFNLDLDWQRDHIYYGLTNTNLSGAFRPNYSEFFTHFTFVGDYSSWMDKISDQEDPEEVDNLSITDMTSKEKVLHNLWTDGAFEFQIRVLINSTNGMGSTLTKYFSAKPNELIEVTSWKTVYIGYPFKCNVYIPEELGNKYYNPDLELLAWDLANYGMSWKFTISEVDPSQEVSETAEITSVYATNFDIDGDIIKVGLKFGGSYKETYQSSCTIKTKLESDDLGECILSFGEPVITSKDPSTNLYNIREISTGWCSFSIIPRKVY